MDEQRKIDDVEGSLGVRIERILDVQLPFQLRSILLGKWMFPPIPNSSNST